jgi:ABC-type transport system involved in cytochrome c biogenesis permease component
MNFTISPILMKELRSRMRDKKTPLWTTSILFLTALTIILVMYAENSYSNTETRDLSNIGITTFAIITGALYIFSALTSATVSASSFSIEREQETLEMLLLTRMSSLQMVMGKIYGSMAFILYLVVLFIPVAAVSFIFGGISPWQLILVFLVILVSAFCYCSIGTFASIIQKKSNSAVAFSYVTILYFLIGLPILFTIPFDDLFDDFLPAVFGFITLYIPFAIFLMELTIATRIAKFSWITKIFVIFLFCVAVGVIQIGVHSFLKSINLEEIVISLNPISFGIYIFNDHAFGSSSSLDMVGIGTIFFLFTILLSAAFIKMSANRLNLMRRGIGLH